MIPSSEDQLRDFQSITRDVEMGEGVRLSRFINLYGCKVGERSVIGAFVEIQKGARVGAYSKVSSHSFICEGVSVGDRCFIGHGVMFTNDRTPRATNDRGDLQDASDWTMVPTFIEDDVSIGSGATILPGVRIGRGAMVGAGAVVTSDVEPMSVVVGVPARDVGAVPDLPRFKDGE